VGDYSQINEEQKNGQNPQQQPQFQVQSSSDKSWFQRLCPCFTIDFFQGYFEITTNELLHRLLTSLIPFNRKFYQTYKQKPDLYGPFWIYTTLIMILSIAGNYSLYLQSTDMGSGKEFKYNFNFIPIAATIIYCMGLGLPLSLKLLMRFVGSNFFNGTFIEVSTCFQTNYGLDHGHLRLLLHQLPHHCLRLRFPHFKSAVGVPHLLCSHHCGLPDGYLLERPSRELGR
jgi:hypothetical protein